MFAPVFTTVQVREIERSVPAAPDAPRLMERAGMAAAEYARSIMGDTHRNVLVLAGPGNNGGDAFEVATHLKRWFYRVSLVFAGERGKLSEEAAAAFEKWKAAGGALEQRIPEGVRWDLVIDGLFGIGLQRPLAGKFAEMIEAANALGAPRVLALDIPSGVNADTGAIMGCAMNATHTITFIGAKPGLLTLDGPDCCGSIEVDPLALDCEALVAKLERDAAPRAQGSRDSALWPCGRLLDAGIVPLTLAQRPQNFHKGQAGNVAILGGAPGMVGAAILAGRAALQCGAGRVYVALLDPLAPTLDYMQPELMLRSSEGLFGSDFMNVIAVGPGMGKSDDAGRALVRMLQSPSVLVLDADALNLLGANASLIADVAARHAPTLLTPHPAEAGRLLGISTREVQADRIAAALAIAERYRAQVALKGNGTIVAAPGGRWWINPSGNPGMASAGMGDALTGIVAAILAQGAAPIEALLAGVWLHGAAGDGVARGRCGPLGVTASDVIERARIILNQNIYPTSSA